MFSNNIPCLSAWSIIMILHERKCNIVYVTWGIDVDLRVKPGGQHLAFHSCNNKVQGSRFIDKTLQGAQQCTHKKGSEWYVLNLYKNGYYSVICVTSWSTESTGVLSKPISCWCTLKGVQWGCSRHTEDTALIHDYYYYYYHYYYYYCAVGKKIYRAPGLSVHS